MSKKEALEKIEEFFKTKHEKEEVKKIKKLAMANQIKLKDKRKLFCNKCYSMNLRVRRIKSGYKTVECECGNKMKFKI